MDSVLSLMTFEEKVGQLTLFTSDLTTTGPTIRDDYAKLIREGKVGALFNAYGSEYTRKLQEMAVEETRLGSHCSSVMMSSTDLRRTFLYHWEKQPAGILILPEDRHGLPSGKRQLLACTWTFAPMVDIARDPRWGRIAEGAGEDPYLGSRFAETRVEGFQGQNLRGAKTVLACLKHLAAYGASEGGRDYNTVNMSEGLLREIYLPPFKAVVDAGVATVMTSFNELNGVPATANGFLFNRVLRGEWNFNGFVVTDYTSIPERIAHGFVPDETEVEYEAIQVNVDMDCKAAFTCKSFPDWLKEAALESEVDEAVQRILRMKFKLGLFEDHYRYINSELEKKEILSEKNRELAREVARESIILLKNESSLLPLSKDITELAVIGPLADNKQELLGSWSAAGEVKDNVMLLQGIREKLGSDAKITYVKGVK